jgi:hypothetical protein
LAHALRDMRQRAGLSPPASSAGEAPCWAAIRRAHELAAAGDKRGVTFEGCLGTAAGPYSPVRWYMIVRQTDGLVQMFASLDVGKALSVAKHGGAAQLPSPQSTQHVARGSAPVGGASRASVPAAVAVRAALASGQCRCGQQGRFQAAAAARSGRRERRAVRRWCAPGGARGGDHASAAATATASATSQRHRAASAAASQRHPAASATSWQAGSSAARADV